jgi:hypothetical protein
VTAARDVAQKWRTNAITRCEDCHKREACREDCYYTNVPNDDLIALCDAVLNAPPREPTRAMLAALDAANTGDKYLTLGRAVDYWQAMYDAAKEHP